MRSKRNKKRRDPRQKSSFAHTAKPPARTEPVSIDLIRIIACGTIFVVMVMLKLVMPGGLSAVRGTLGSWLVHDADFAAAFSAVGHAVSGEGSVLESFEDAYRSVFGPAKAAEVSGAAEIPDVSEGEEDGQAAKTVSTVNGAAYPEHTVAEQRVLGFESVPPIHGDITSGFGWREHPVDGRESFHYGIDIAAEEGTDIVCFADGRVGVVADSVELGKYLTVHHANGVMTLYGHCSRIIVSSGESVKLGQKLAEAGSTGNATGTHLHFEIQDGEDHLDPVYYLS